MAAPTAEEREQAGYHLIGQWHAWDNFKCRFCAFASVVEEEVRKHCAIHKSALQTETQNRMVERIAANTRQEEKGED